MTPNGPTPEIVVPVESTNFMQVGYPRISWEVGDKSIEDVYAMMARMSEVKRKVIEGLSDEVLTKSARKHGECFGSGNGPSAMRQSILDGIGGDK